MALRYINASFCCFRRQSQSMRDRRRALQLQLNRPSYYSSYSVPLVPTNTAVEPVVPFVEFEYEDGRIVPILEVAP